MVRASKAAPRVRPAGPVGAAHQTHPRLLQGCGHPGEVIGAHLHVGVGDDQEIIPGVGQQLPQGADFGIEAQIFRQIPQLPTRGWEGVSQFLEQGQQGISRILNPEDHLIGVIVLVEKTLQAFPGEG